MRYLSYIVFCLFSFAMCTEQPKELLPELSYAESLMQRCPNSAPGGIGFNGSTPLRQINFNMLRGVC